MRLVLEPTISGLKGGISTMCKVRALLFYKSRSGFQSYPSLKVAFFHDLHSYCLVDICITIGLHGFVLRIFTMFKLHVLLVQEITFVG